MKDLYGHEYTDEELQAIYDEFNNLVKNAEPEKEITISATTFRDMLEEVVRRGNLLGIEDDYQAWLIDIERKERGYDKQ